MQTRIEHLLWMGKQHADFQNEMLANRKLIENNKKELREDRKLIVYNQNVIGEHQKLISEGVSALRHDLGKISEKQGERNAPVHDIFTHHS